MINFKIEITFEGEDINIIVSDLRANYSTSVPCNDIKKFPILDNMVKAANLIKQAYTGINKTKTTQSS